MEKEQQPLILVSYIEIGNAADYEVMEIVEKVRKAIVNPEEKNIKHFIIPVRDQGSKIECINPVRVSDDEYKLIEEKLQNCEKELHKVLKNYRKEKEQD